MQRRLGSRFETWVRRSSHGVLRPQLTDASALKYHPDRNPGKEAEFKDKFQAIQAAHEVLTDPQQKAKYDADRIRQGLFAANYSTPTRPDMPPRGATTAFGPPPRRAAPGPTPTANTAGPKQFYATQGATGGPRYTTRNRPGYPPYEPDATPKQSDHYTTFQNMRQPRDKYTPNGKAQRPREPFSPSSDSFGENTRNFAPKTPSRTSGVPPAWKDPRKAGPTGTREGWDDFVRQHEAKHQPPIPPALGRSNTTRLPKKNGFAPSMSGPDEPPARHTSAYQHVNRGPSENIKTQFPPPPPGGPPGHRSRPPSPDSRPRSYHSPVSDDPLSNSDRLSTPYATTGGERTYFSHQGVGRSKSVRTNQASAPTTAVPPHVKTSPVPPPNSSSRHRSASPRGVGRSPRPRYYPNSSDSSSDDDEDIRGKYAYRRASHDHRATSRRSPAAHSRHAHRHSRKESEDSEEDIPTFKPSRHYPDGPPRSRKVNADPDLPEGFRSHRARMDAERNQRSTPSAAHVKSPSYTSQPWTGEYPKPVEKSKSWYETYGSKEDGNKRKEYDRPTTADAKESPNMYDQYVSFPSPTHGSSPLARPSPSSHSPSVRLDGRYAYRPRR